MVTMPNWPCTLSAGRYEKATPPEKTEDMLVLSNAPTSVQRRGGDVIHPNSLKYATTLKFWKSLVVPE